jgi:hypothetical protein
LGILGIENRTFFFLSFPAGNYQNKIIKKFIFNFFNFCFERPCEQISPSAQGEQGGGEEGEGQGGELVRAVAPMSARSRLCPRGHMVASARTRFFIVGADGKNPFAGKNAFAG